MAKKQASVWVVVHCEYVDTDPNVFVDCLVCHVLSSRQRAEVYIRNWLGATPWSWWELREFVVDSKEHDPHEAASEVLFYSHRGTPLRRAPFKRARAAYDRELRRRAEEAPPG
jgi:hypothetical protein